MEQASGQRRRYSREFKQAAVCRLLAGESATAIARELKIRRKFLYAWRNEGFGVENTTPHRASLSEGDPLQQQIAKQQQKIAELERLTGQQAAQLDFFAAALRAIKESRPNKSASSATGSTQRSKV